MTLVQYFATSGSLTKLELAERIGMDKTYLSRLLSGERVAGPRWIPALCRVTGGRVRPKDLNPRIAKLFTSEGTIRVTS